MNIKLNGENHEVGEALTLQELLTQLAYAAERIAIELNRQVIPRKKWHEIVLTDGDQLEIVHFVGGGKLKLK